jgi:hypothetical protein
MASLEDSLGQLCADIERQLKPAVRGIFGGIVRGYLPQRWQFTTENDAAIMSVDSAGNATVIRGGSKDVDVSVQTTAAKMVAIVKYRDASKVPAGIFEVTTHTAKGKTAFGFLRGRLGL